MIKKCLLTINQKTKQTIKYNKKKPKLKKGGPRKKRKSICTKNVTKTNLSMN